MPRERTGSHLPTTNCSVCAVHVLKSVYAQHCVYIEFCGQALHIFVHNLHMFSDSAQFWGNFRVFSAYFLRKRTIMCLCRQHLTERTQMTPQAAPNKTFHSLSEQKVTQNKPKQHFSSHLRIKSRQTRTRSSRVISPLSDSAIHN